MIRNFWTKHGNGETDSATVWISYNFHRKVTGRFHFHRFIDVIEISFVVLSILSFNLISNEGWWRLNQGHLFFHAEPLYHIHIITCDQERRLCWFIDRMLFCNENVKYDMRRQGCFWLNLILLKSPRIEKCFFLTWLWNMSEEWTP